MCTVDQVFCKLCVFTSTLCKYDLSKDALFVLNWTNVLRVCLVNASSVVFIGGSGV